MTPQTVDVLVLGGGPAGAAAAVMLARAGAAVTLLERSHYERFRVGESLPPEASVPLGRLGSAGVLLRGHRPFPGTVSAWGDGPPHENDFLFGPYGSGWHLDRRRFDAALAATAAAAGCRVVTGARIARYVERREGWAVTAVTAGGAILVETRRVIDATGRAAWFARRRGANRLASDRLVGVAGVLTGPPLTDERTLIEARGAGWWYSAPLPNGNAIAVFFTDADLLGPGGATCRHRWSEELRWAELTADRLRGHRLDGRVTCLPASSTVLSRIAGAGWVAVGDAACTVDPLSSQGISSALTTGIEAAEAILHPDPAEAADRYAASIESRYREYLRLRRYFYAREGRWPDSPFWRRRSLAVGFPRQLDPRLPDEAFEVRLR